MNMYKNQLFRLGFLIALAMVYSGCVGTVQNSVPAYTNVNEPPVKDIAFTGITNATGVSDSRIEIFFYPAAGGSGKYTYDVTVGGAPFPISISSDTLQPDYRGLLRYTLTGLSRLTSYNIKVEVRDNETKLKSNSQQIRIATTFDNMVADFNGISSASNMPGQDGKDSIRVRWTNARISGSLVKQEWDPKAYELIVVDAERLTPGDMDLPLGPNDGKWTYMFNHDNTLNEYVARGLPAKHRFYMRMRAIHEASVEDVYNPKRRSELNTKYISISTLSDDLADLNFNGDGFAVNLAPGEQGLNAIIGSWQQASGVFDHFRLYYSEVGGGVANNTFPAICLSPLLSPPGETVFCKKADFNQTSTPITGLKPYTEYEVALVLCQTVTCGAFERIISPVRTIKTDPLVPVFNSVREITTANSLAAVGELYLQYDLPNFTAGYFDGVVIMMHRTDDRSDTAYEVTLAPNFHGVSHLPFNFLTSGTITLTGIDYTSDDPYVFTIHPFKWDPLNPPSGRVEYPNNVWRSIKPIIEAPTINQFAGLASGITIGNTVQVTWVPPTKGIYASYELFWKKPHVVGPFDWGQAISEAGNNFNYTNYGRTLLTDTVWDGFSSSMIARTSYVMNNFPDLGPVDPMNAAAGRIPATYIFGIVTHYSYIGPSGNVTLRSETAGSILMTCTVNGASIVAVNCN